MRVVDLSHPLDERTPVYPGDPGLVRTRLMTAGVDGAPYTLNHVAASLHLGTHLDAPAHFLAAGAAIEHTPLEWCVGRAVRIPLENAPMIAPADLRRFAATLRKYRRAVLHTGWSRHWGAERYFTEHPVLTGEAAEYLVDQGVRALGLDFPSPDRAPFPAHPVLLAAGVLLVENLRGLDEIGAEVFEWIVLPLPLTGAEASPVRAVAVLP